MKLLQNKTNVSAPDATYPYGNLKNDTGAGDGTPVDVEMLTDYVQVFEKIFADSGLTANGLPDNATNGFQLYDAFKRLTREYKVYSGTISQTGTNPPVVTVLGFNQIGNIVWTYDGVGTYFGTLTGAFPDATKVQLFISSQNSGFNEAHLVRNSANQLAIFTSVSGAATNGILNNSTIEIRVYP